MIKLLIVAAWEERRATLVDALCELPGIEVRATASDASTALGIIEASQIDAVVVTNDLPDRSVVTLIDSARRRGLTEIIVAVADEAIVPGMDACWRDLGAHHIVHVLPELVARVAELTLARRDDAGPRPALPTVISHGALVTAEQAATLRMHATAAVAAIATHGDGPARAPQDLSLATVLHNALVRFGRVLPTEVQVHLEVGLDVPRVRCVAADIERLAFLLVRGACDALPLGGKVWLCVERDGQHHVRIEVLESSGRPRTPGGDADLLRAIAKRNAGELHVVDLGGGATSLQVILPAPMQVPS